MLIVLTLIFIVALVFVTLFGSKDEEVAPGATTGAGLSPELEKSLQKLIESQGAKSAVFDFSKGQAADPKLQIAPAAATPEMAAEIEKAKAEVAQKEKVIQELQTQLSQAAAKPAAPAAADSSGLEAKIKELEARLAEYDIISEDIADLSRYKEENEKLRAQLAGGGAAAPQPAAPQPPPQAAPAPEPEPVAAASIPVDQPLPETTPEPAAPELKVVEGGASEEEEPINTATIDDDLMKEFAAAVEGQKAAQEQAGAAPAAPANSAENEDLMGQFENFVQKKEGS